MLLTPEQIKALDNISGIQDVGSQQDTLNAQKKADEILSWANPEPVDKGSVDRFGGTAQGIARGIAKGELATVKGLSDVGEKFAGQTVGRVINLASGKGFTPTEFKSPMEETMGKERTGELTTPEGTAEKIGFGAEKIAEFFIPAGAVSKTEKTINLLSQGLSPVVGATTRILGKAAVSGGAAGLVRAAQTGGDIEETAKTALTAGVIRGGMASLGEGARAIKFPERLYSTIFKNSKKDMMSTLKGNGLVEFQKNNPQKFNEFVDKGIIKLDPKSKFAQARGTFTQDGSVANVVKAHSNWLKEVGQSSDDVYSNASQKILKPEVAQSAIDDGFNNLRTRGMPEAANAFKKSLEASKNNLTIDKILEEGQRITSKLVKPADLAIDESLASQALHRALKGDVKTMANEVVRKTFEAEDELRTVLGKYPGKVNMKEKQFVNLLKEISDDYRNVGLGEISDKADDIINRINDGKGMVDGNTALEARRLLDKIRIGSSFDRPVTKLSMTQGNLKSFSDLLRGRINEIPKVQGIMDDYVFNIDALEELSKIAQRTGNNQVIGMIDSFIGGQAITAPTVNQGIGATALALARKILASPKGVTHLAQLIQKGVIDPKSFGIIGAYSGLKSQESEPSPQEQI